jgi:hypothetical protein
MEDPMRFRYLVWGTAAALAGMVTLASVTAQGQAPSASPTAAAANSAVPRLADGKPDMMGVWAYATITPFERPDELAGKTTFSDEEAAEFERETLAQRDNDRRDDDPARRGVVNGQVSIADVARAYNQFWWDYGTNVVGTRQTSLVVDPPDGKIPALTPAARARQDERAKARERAAIGPEDRSPGERCINWGVAGPPMRPGAYNNHVQIFQTPQHVVLFNEMIHDARIVPMDGRGHGSIRRIQGDSVGRWEGDTLVVETINFTDLTSFQGATENMHLVERFTRINADTLIYEYTVTDPAAFVRPFTVSIPMTRTDSKIYEYACHEGNYGMTNLLSGARAIEKAAKEAALKGSK